MESGHSLCDAQPVPSVLNTLSTVLLLAVAAAGCVAMGTPLTHRGNHGQIDQKTVEHLESELAFREALREIGAPGVVAEQDAGNSYRVRVRSMTCRSLGADVTCSYLTKPCFDALPEQDPNSWCTRQRVFTRIETDAPDEWAIAVASDK